MVLVNALLTTDLPHVRSIPTYTPNFVRKIPEHAGTRC